MTGMRRQYLAVVVIGFSLLVSPLTAGSSAGPVQTHGYLPILELPLAPECLGSLGYFPPSVATAIVAAPDGNIWYVCGVYLARMAPDGQTTAYQISTQSSPQVMTLGPDGNLWYGQFWAFASWIGQFSLITGIVASTYLTPVQITLGFGGITTGPDGNLWFSARNNTQGLPSSIVRLTLDGTATAFDLSPSADDYFGQDIASGPDGNLWFTRYAGNTIGRITPTGTITEFPIPTAASGAKSITLGPDGNLWFTELNADQIGQITPAGVITEFPLPIVDSQPWDILGGPDGNVWFTEPGTNRIGRITPAGIVTEYFIPTPDANPREIAVGPDGNLWFTELGAAKLGKILWRQDQVVFLPLLTR